MGSQGKELSKHLFSNMHRPSYSLYLSVCLATLVSASPFKITNTCADFTSSACDLSESNIVDHNRFTNTPGECQDLCGEKDACNWFTHYNTQCYLLSYCGELANCPGCVSGPTSPDFESCQDTTNPPSSTATTNPSTTTKITTTTTTSTTIKTTTTTSTTTTTTAATTTSTHPPPQPGHCSWIEAGLCIGEIDEAGRSPACAHLNNNPLAWYWCIYNLLDGTNCQKCICAVLPLLCHH